MSDNGKFLMAGIGCGMLMVVFVILFLPLHRTEVNSKALHRCNIASEKYECIDRSVRPSGTHNCTCLGQQRELITFDNDWE